MKRQSIYLAVGLSLFFAVVLAIKSHQPTPVEFDSLDDCKTVLESRGFHCVYLKDPNFHKLVISMQPITEQEATEYSVSFAHLSRHSEKALVVRFNPDDNFVESPRYWGKVVSLGNKSMLDAIEQSH